MDPQFTSILAGLMPMLEGMVALGVPGLLLGMAAIPAIVIALMCWLNYRHDKQIQKVLEAHRTDTQKVLEAYRADTQEILKTLSLNHEECVSTFTAKHQEVVRFYTNNVSLAKNNEKLVEASQALIVNNTRAMEHLTVVIESIAKNRA